MAGSFRNNIYEIEEFANKDSFFHRRHSLANMINCIAFILITVSFQKYSFSQILPLVFYPIVLLYIGEIPAKAVLYRTLPVFPIIIGLGLFNPIFDTNTIIIGNIALSAGWLSFASLALKGFLCAFVSILTVCVTGIDGISEAMRCVCVPSIFITQFTLTFRYFQILSGEAERILLAYNMRAGGKRFPEIKEWGALTGGWIIRTIGRADRIYSAMLLKQFSGVLPYPRKKRFGVKDFLLVIVCVLFFVIIRLISIPELVGNAILSIGG